VAPPDPTSVGESRETRTSMSAELFGTYIPAGEVRNWTPEPWRMPQPSVPAPEKVVHGSGPSEPPSVEPSVGAAWKANV
jgi:hypothetical protein